MRTERRIAYEKKWELENRERRLAQAKVNYKRNKVKRLAQTRAWQKANPEKVKASLLRYKRKWQAALATRPKSLLCEVCNSPGTPYHGIVFDHDHKTDTFRGWLCAPCNSVLGLANDSATTLRALARYLDNGGKI